MKEIQDVSYARRRLLGTLPALSALSIWTPGARAQLSSTPEPDAKDPVSKPLPGPSQPQRRKRLVLAGPPSAVSYPLIHIVESGALADVAEQVEFVQWTNPDQLRAIALGGDADFIAVPTNVAANLYNRGVLLTLVNVSVWGILWMVSRSHGMQTLADFKGQELAIPFRADMPDILFGFLIEQQGLDLRKDFRVRYTSTPMDAIQLLVMHQVDHALLAEPAVSMALRKTQSFPLSIAAPKLYRSVDLQEEWGRVLRREPRIPQAGIAALGQVREDAMFIEQFEGAYAASNTWCADHPTECGRMVARHMPMVMPEAVADSIRVAPRHYATAIQAKPELDYFYGLLLDRQPAVIGGTLPDADFYGASGVPR